MTNKENKDQKISCRITSNTKEIIKNSGLSYGDILSIYADIESDNDYSIELLELKRDNIKYHIKLMEVQLKKIDLKIKQSKEFKEKLEKIKEE